MGKLPKMRGRPSTVPVSQQAIERLELEDILIKAGKFGLAEIKHPNNIASGIIAGQSLTKDQILLELGMPKSELLRTTQLVERKEPGLLSEYRLQKKKEIKENLKDNAETYLASIFDGTEFLDTDKKSRLALDVLKATDKEYNQTTATPISINLGELPLGDGLFEAQKKIVLELGITSDIFNNLDN